MLASVGRGPVICDHEGVLITFGWAGNKIMEDKMTCQKCGTVLEDRMKRPASICSMHSAPEDGCENCHTTLVVKDGKIVGTKIIMPDGKA